MPSVSVKRHKGRAVIRLGVSSAADLDAEEFDCPIAGPWTRGLLIRRNIADGDPACFTTWCPKETAMQELVNVEGTRWRIEECFETAKNEFGLDHYETRAWHGWHRHVSLVMLAYAIMASIRYQANSLKSKKNTAPDTAVLVRWSIQEIRRPVVKLSQRRLPVAHTLKWSVFRRTHQASAIRAHSQHKGVL